MVEQQSAFLCCGSVQNGCLLTADADGNFDPDKDILQLEPVPIEIGQKLAKMELYCGTKYVVAVGEDEVSIWGEQYARADQSKPIIPHPQKLNFPMPVLSVACGFDHTLCLTSSQVFGWGSNSQGQLGFAPKQGRLIKAPIALEIPNVTKIAAGVRTSFFLTQNLMACGFNKDRALGCGLDAPAVCQPTVVALSCKPITQILPGFKHTVIQGCDGRLYGAGSNNRGQIASLKGDPLIGFQEMHLPTSIKGFGCSWNNTVVWSEDAIWITGDNKYGQLGNDHPDAFSYEFVKVRIDAPVKKVLCQSESFIAFVGGPLNKVYSWGWNEHGNLGLGDRQDRRLPVEIDLKTGVRISVGGAYFFAAS